MLCDKKINLGKTIPAAAANCATIYAAFDCFKIAFFHFRVRLEKCKRFEINQNERNDRCGWNEQLDI